jgi:hypothetical protein
MRRRIARALAIGAACAALSLVRPESVRALEPPDQSETAAVAEPHTPPPHEYTDVEDPHDPTKAMHPVRVAAYVLHPVGVLLDYALVRPAVWVVRQEPFRTIFGYGDD